MSCVAAMRTRAPRCVDDVVLIGGLAGVGEEESLGTYRRAGMSVSRGSVTTLRYRSVMGLYYRKSVSFGPLRLNLSKKGLGASFGVAGLRVGKQAGRSGLYARGGKRGVYFRTKLG